MRITIRIYRGHVAEEAEKLKIFSGEEPPEQMRRESTVVLGNHSDTPKPPVRVKVTPEALELMLVREKQADAPGR